MHLTMVLDDGADDSTPAHERRALAGEYREVQVRIESREDAVRGARLLLQREPKQQTDDAAEVDAPFFWTAPHKPTAAGSEIALPDMEPGSSSSVSFFVRFSEPAMTTGTCAVAAR